MLHSHPSRMVTTADESAVGGVRLTRRGRLVLIGAPILALTVGLLVGLALLVGSFANMAQAAEGDLPGVDVVEVTVAPGDTLWSVARGVDAGEDTQILISQIAEFNDLASSELHPGQVLEVPVAD